MFVWLVYDCKYFPGATVLEVLVLPDCEFRLYWLLSKELSIKRDSMIARLPSSLRKYPILMFFFYLTHKIAWGPTCCCVHVSSPNSLHCMRRKALSGFLLLLFLDHKSFSWLNFTRREALESCWLWKNHASRIALDAKHYVVLRLCFHKVCISNGWVLMNHCWMCHSNKKRLELMRQSTPRRFGRGPLFYSKTNLFLWA